MKHTNRPDSGAPRQAFAEPLEPRTLLSANLRPIITGLSDAPDPARYGDNVVLTASGVSDPDGSVAAVEFYLDSNNDGLLTVGQDRYLGVDRSPKQGYTFSTPAMSLPTGTNRYFAWTRDNLGSRSKAARTLGVVSSAINFVGRWTGTANNGSGSMSMVMNILTQSGSTPGSILTGTIVTDDTVTFTATVAKGGKITLSLRNAAGNKGSATATIGVSNYRLTISGTWTMNNGYSGTYAVTKA